jgi:hypothetical protein|nr:MAG TPA: hypothetical protein [Caudoviricetes sp.]DAR41176.1 MAG TPA: hypothetical protein [Caudoviricetes sp.]DAR60982.1 MAG TPA: hypothetical protein [Caudoviricetes sp.]
MMENEQLKIVIAQTACIILGIGALLIIFSFIKALFIIESYRTIMLLAFVVTIALVIFAYITLLAVKFICENIEDTTRR